MTRSAVLALAGCLTTVLATPTVLTAGSLQLPGAATMPEIGLDLVSPAPARNRGEVVDEVFRSGFETRVLIERVTTYDELAEGHAGTSFHHDGVTYRDLNEVNGMWPGPENEPFGPGAVADGGLGNQFVIEDAGLLFDDFPEFGSAPNVLNPGDLFYSLPGPNLSLGPLASLWMDLDEVAYGAGAELVYFENGPWGGIEVSLEAFLGGESVAVTRFEITSDDPEGRDNVSHRAIALPDDVAFDALHLYARRLDNGEYTAPRIMLDNLRLGRWSEVVENITTYDDLAESYAGTSFQHRGVTYRDLNEVSGMWPGPENIPFGPGAVGDGGIGNQLIIEDAGMLFDDFPEFGSAPNVLNFGDLFYFSPGPGLSIGPLASVWMDLDTPAHGVSAELVYYENGPWAGIEVSLEGFRNGVPVAVSRFEITSVDPLGRDNVAYRAVGLPEGVAVDSLHLYARRLDNGEYTVPRVMLDNLRLLQAR